MKNTTVLLIAAALILAGAGANEVLAQYGTGEAVEAPEAAPSVKVGNKICPVEGGAIGSMGEGVEVVYEGKVYNLCCAACAESFNADPAKYSKIADAEVAAFAAAPAAEEAAGEMMDEVEEAADEMMDEAGAEDAMQK